MKIVDFELVHNALPRHIRAVKSTTKVVGSEGEIYFSLDGQFVFKVYNSLDEMRKRQICVVIEAGERLASPLLLVPLAFLHKMNGYQCAGIVMKRAPIEAVPLADVMFSPIEAYRQFQHGWHWGDYLEIARNIAKAVQILHEQGFIHNDLHFHNILVDQRTKSIYLIDLDGAIDIEQFVGVARGKWGFIAPEIVAKEAPTIASDAYSLAIIVMWTILFRNVMLPQVCFDDNNQLLDYQIAYNEHAVFSEHPTNHQNSHEKIGQPLYFNGALSYKSLTPFLKLLVEKTFIDGLYDKHLRPSAAEWGEALDEVKQYFIQCRNKACGQVNISQSFFSTCIFCGDPLI